MHPPAAPARRTRAASRASRVARNRLAGRARSARREDPALELADLLVAMQPPDDRVGELHRGARRATGDEVAVLDDAVRDDRDALRLQLVGDRGMAGRALPGE